jgi:hypothetical protein
MHHGSCSDGLQLSLAGKNAVHLLGEGFHLTSAQDGVIPLAPVKSGNSSYYGEHFCGFQW